MGKALLIGTAAFLALGTYYGAIRTSSEIESRRHIYNSQYEAVTRLAALAGLNVARQTLTEDWRDRDLRGFHHSASYRTVVTISGKRADVVSTGSVQDASGESSEYTARTRIEKVLASTSGAPAWMQFAVATDKDLQLKGNIEVYSESAEHNANVHTNGTLTVKGNSVDVRGFGSYTKGYSGKSSHVRNAFDPYDNAGDTPVHGEAAEIDIPDFDLQDYIDRVRPDGSSYLDHSTRDNVELNGHYSFGGTRDDPYVWFVDGNLRVTGNSVLDGYNVFLVKGNIEIEKSLLAGDTGHDVLESSIALYGDGNLKISGNRTVEGQVFVKGNAQTVKGTPTIRGNIVANGNVELKGTPDIEFRPASGTLSYLWGRTFETLVVTSYYEH